MLMLMLFMLELSLDALAVLLVTVDTFIVGAEALEWRPA